jgi:hypothetical protein
VVLCICLEHFDFLSHIYYMLAPLSTNGPGSVLVLTCETSILVVGLHFTFGTSVVDLPGTCVVICEMSLF